VHRTNVEFQKIGLRGTSILVASGDSGANSRTDETCSGPTLNPDFPAASPYVTTVGATQIQPSTQKLEDTCKACTEAKAMYGIGCAISGTEAAVSYAVSEFASGGGFSNFAPTPSYQKSVVKEYLASGVALPPSSYFNSSGRAYPDVAALGNNYLIQIQGEIQPVGGTSCAAPAFAGVVSLLNTHRLSSGGKPLGFLNPFLYQMHAAAPDAYTDITDGDNKCTESGCFASCKGYEATKGWDPVTGLGTPVYSNMLAYLKKMDAERAATSRVLASPSVAAPLLSETAAGTPTFSAILAPLGAALAVGAFVGSGVTHLAHRRRRAPIIVADDADSIKQPLTAQ